MRIRNIIITALVILGISTIAFGQAQHTENKADQTLRGSGRVNPSTLGMEFEVPLGNYSGRGINVPIGLSYSSKVWRMDFRETAPKVGNGNQGCVSVYDAKFGENSASGWNSTMQEAYIEYTGYDNRFNGEGFPQNEPCYNAPPPNNPFGSYIRRIQIHLPSGESHELRLDDSVKIYNRNGCTTPGNILCESNPELPENWNGMYYATDGSNLRYFEDRGNNVYKLLMTDGSYYEFSNAIGASGTYNYKTVRKATRFVDRVGSTNTYHEPTTLFPNGYWTDTVGRNLGVPLPRTAPSAPAIQTYTMPGLTGQNPVTYKFHWKKLKDTSATESALTDFNQDLKYLGNWLGAPYPGQPSRLPEACLFHSDWENWAVHPSYIPIFNPVLLTAIELPTGQLYKFSYTVSGEIDRIYYPTGGQERFEYSTIPALTQQEQPAQSVIEANRGVLNRKVYENGTTQTPYQSTYSVMYVYPSGYAITTNNPDGTKSERFLFQGNQSNPGATQGDWGYDNGLAGMAYEERAYSSTGQLVNRKLSHWEISKLPITFTAWYEPYGAGSFGNLGTWHPRVTQEESFIYDDSGNGVSAVTKIEYEGDLNQINNPLLPNKTSQYAFTSLTVPTLNPNPDPNPTPVPMVSPPTLLRTSETQYLQSDPNIPQLRKDVYKSINMVGLATSSVVKDGSGNIVSRSEMAYDETGYSPSIWHGNPTTSRVWDSTKDINPTNPSAYLETHAKFDYHGNNIESTDAKGNTIKTYYDSTHIAFPIRVETAVPDPSGQNGSNTAFETTMTYDFNTGLPLTTTDANGQTTTIEYDAATLRAKKVTPPTGAGLSETIYNDAPNNYWVKNRTQIDANNWAESITYFDGLGRAYKSEKVDADGNIFTETEFDSIGRPKKISNPYRTGEVKKWTTNIYDEQSRVKQVNLPDIATVKTDYGVSTTGVIGITKQITDQAGKKRKGITDALGRMVRVIEDPTGQNLATDYVFDTLGNLRKTIQGEQSRYFTYDSLGRLLYAKQPEQEVNTTFVKTDLITGNTAWSVKYQYDDNGNIVSTTDARGVSVSATYDNFNRLKLRDYSDTTPDVNFYYDGKYLDINNNVQIATGSVKGKTTGIKSSVSKTNYTSFDNLGQVKSSQQITNGTAYNFLDYSYNLSGDLMSQTYPSGRIVVNTLDANGDIAKVESQKDANSALKIYANNIKYNSFGGVEQVRLGNGKFETT